MIGSLRGRRGRRLTSAAALCLVLTSCGGQPAVQPAAAPSAFGPSQEAAPADSQNASATSASEATAPTPLARSEPAVLAIPSLGVRSEPMQVGLRQDGSLEVPPGDPGSPAAWYVHSPTPGERGPSVFLGHVSAYGNKPGVFARLAELNRGDVVEVGRRDGATVVFEVTRVEAFQKDSFPTDEVYGDTQDPQLRLITCDGYNPFTRTFEENLVVFAREREVR